MKKKLLLLTMSVGIIYAAFSQNPVAENGKLKVDGVQLVNEDGNPVQLRGMSTHGINWFAECMKKSTITALADDWGADIVRAAMYVSEDYNGYKDAGNRAALEEQINDIVTWTEAAGLYCLIDWHILHPGDPTDANYSEAGNFFTKMSEKYKDKKHVLYEICNEPNPDGGADDSWATIKKYAEGIIPKIRVNDPKAVIIVGTPNWSQEIWEVVGNELDYDNIMYTFHFYAGSHGGLLSQFKNTITKIPVFCTEWGLSEANGDGTITDEFKTTAADFLDCFAGDNTNGIKTSWCAWAFADKNETSNVLEPGSCKSSSWSNTTPTGDWIKARMITKDTWTPIGGGVEKAPTMSLAKVDAYGNINIEFSAEIATISGTPNITVYINGTAASISSISKKLTNQIEIQISNTIKGGDAISVSYNDTNLKGANGIEINPFSANVNNTIVDANAQTLIDDCEDGDDTHELGGEWYTFDDSNDDGNSEVTPAAGTFSMQKIGANGSAKSAGIEYNLDKGTYIYDPFVGLGFKLDPDEKPYDVKSSTGISFYHKGDAFTLEVALSTITNYQNFATEVIAHTNWTKVTIDWAKLDQPDWGDGNKYVTWNPAKLTKIQFKIGGSTGDAGNLYIDDVTIEGVNLLSNNTQNALPIVSAPIANQNFTKGFSSENIRISSVFTDGDGDLLTITTKSSNTSVVTATVNGSIVNISEVGNGTSTITLTASDNKGGIVSQTFTVTVKEAGAGNTPPKLTSSIGDVALKLGFDTYKIDLADYVTDTEGGKLTYTATSDNSALAIISMNESVLTIKETGKTGSATLTISVTDEDDATLKTTLVLDVAKPDPESILWNAPSQGTLNLVKESTYSLTASIQPVLASGDIEWTSSDDKIVTITDGVISAISSGSAVVTVLISGTTIKETITVQVTNDVVNPSGIKILSEIKQPILEDGPFVIAVIAEPSNATTPVYNWMSSDKSIATVDDFGVITPIGTGTAIITVETNGVNGSITKQITINIVSNKIVTIVDDFESIVLDLYPMPLGDLLHIKSNSEIKSVIIYTLDGQLVTRVDNSNAIDLPDLAKGCYILQVINTSGKIRTQKVTK